MTMTEMKRILKTTLMLMAMVPAMRVDGKMYLENGGYKNVLITINPDANIDRREEMLDKLQEIFEDASSTLFRATKNRVYFKEIIVLVPGKWKTQKHYDNALETPLHRPDIIVDTPNPAYGNAPYVRQFQQCGSPGLHMHLTPGYVLDEVGDALKWGKPGKTLVHEWAHLRWGLFDEYPIDEQDAEFYRYYGMWQPTRCNNQVQGYIQDAVNKGPCGVDSMTGDLDPNCRFVAKREENKATASLMFMHYLESVVDFCDNETSDPQSKHNRLAPNRQNRHCDYKSAWEVMREHEDFANNSKTLPENTDTVPFFRFVQSQHKKRVIVLDTSGSMGIISMGLMRMAMRTFIQGIVETDSELGIVEFNKNTTILANLTKVTNEAVRDYLVSRLPTSAQLGTHVIKGLLRGMEVLNQTGSSSGGSLILVTDGKYKNESKTNLRTVVDTLMEKGIIVHTFAFGQKADERTEDISRMTGGLMYYYSGKHDSTAFIDGLAGTVASDSSASLFDVPQTITTFAGLVNEDKGSMAGTFYVDGSVDRDITVMVSYSDDLTVSLKGPAFFSVERLEKSCKDDEDDECPTEFSFFRKVFKGTLQEVEWAYNISSSGNASFSFSVQTKARQMGVPVITARSWIGGSTEVTFDLGQKLGVFAEVTRGTAPVLGAVVMASVEMPGTEIPLEMQLFDMGTGVDIIKSDGIYGAYILATDFKGNGRYSIKVKVTGIEGQVEVVEGEAGTASGALAYDPLPRLPSVKTTKTGNFQRMTSGGAFRLRKFPSSAVLIQDKIPPSRITDLRVMAMDRDFVVTLRWTAPGGNMDRGTASKYYVYVVKDDFRQLLTNQRSDKTLSQNDVTKGNLSRPNPARHPEQMDMILTILKQSNSAFIAITAVDRSNNEGAISNIISLSVATRVSVPSVESRSSDVHPTAKYLAIGLSLGTAQVLTLIIGAVMIVKRRKNSKQQDDGSLAE